MSASPTPAGKTETRDVAMKWIFLAPFNSDLKDVWLFRHGNLPGHSAQTVPKSYQHDRSRSSSGLREWRDFLWHGLRGALAVRRSRGQVGIITAFPQLTAIVALLKFLRIIPKVPVVAWYFNMNRPYQGFKGALARAVLHQIDCFVVHSRAEISTYSQWLQLPQDRFSFVPLTAVVPEVAANLAIVADPNKPYVLAMGSANRDYRTLMAAVAVLGYPTVVVAGAHAVEGLNVPGNVQVRSGLTITECHTLAKQAAVNVIPIASVGAASGQVTLIESMMLGAPLVVTRCAGTEDYIEDGADALLVPPQDVAAMGAAIARLWHAPELRARLAEKAKDHAVTQYTPEAVVRQLGEILNRFKRP